jgi:hypothetical protein
LISGEFCKNIYIQGFTLKKFKYCHSEYLPASKGKQAVRHASGHLRENLQTKYWIGILKEEQNDKIVKNDFFRKNSIPRKNFSEGSINLWDPDFSKTLIHPL